MKHSDFHDLHLTVSLKQDRSCKLITLVKNLRISKQNTFPEGLETNPLPIKNLRLSVKVKKHTIKIQYQKENIHPTWLQNPQRWGGMVWASQNQCTTLRAELCLFRFSSHWERHHFGACKDVSQVCILTLDLSNFEIWRKKRRNSSLEKHIAPSADLRGRFIHPSSTAGSTPPKI